MTEEKGLTLVEVMVAVTIFSLTIITLLSLYEISLGTTSRAEKETQAIFLAQEKLEEAKELLLKGEFPALEGSGGVNSEFTYVYDISAPDENGVREIVVTVYYEEKGKEKSVVLMTRLGERKNAGK